MRPIYPTTKSAILVLADGVIFEGVSIGVSGFSVGELVFNTAMTGYQEILTDPSYARQIVTLTTPHVGNTGCNIDDTESQRVWASGLVVRNHSDNPSNYRSTQSFTKWLKTNKVVAISGIDTRALTLHIRNTGSMNACIHTDMNAREQALKLAKDFKGLLNCDLAKEVSRTSIENWTLGRGEWSRTKIRNNQKRCKVVVYDFGVKHNILRILFELGCDLTLVPATTPAAEVLKMRPDGIFFSNGPGDPGACDYAIDAIKIFLNEKIPFFGICLGFQILSLALGAKSIKMKFGHHGANHPVIELTEKRQIFITSQNHGFSIDESSLPSDVEVTHRSLFDDSLQGIRHKSIPAYGFQGHPEASPGPQDIEIIFKEFITACQKHTY